MFDVGENNHDRYNFYKKKLHKTRFWLSFDLVKFSVNSINIISFQVLVNNQKEIFLFQFLSYF